MEFKDILKEKRTASGMSQETLADRIGVTRQLVSKWENGLSEPTITQAVKIAEALNLTLTELLEIDEQPVNQVEKKRAIPQLTLNLSERHWQLIVFLLFAIVSYLNYPYGIWAGIANIVFCFKTNQKPLLKVASILLLLYLIYALLAFYYIPLQFGVITID